MTCPHCTHFRRPGLSAGYCGGREDLPPAYGANHPLRQLPADKGASCKEFQRGASAPKPDETGYFARDEA